MERQRLEKPRVIVLYGHSQHQAAQALLKNMPIDSESPIEMVLREYAKPRKLSQNALMWVGPLADIAEQAWIDGRSYSAEVWHEHFKRQFLPEDFDPAMCREGYRKWDFTPSGERVLVGSTTQLTVKGMAQYLTQIEAAGADMGVQFSDEHGDRS